MHPDDHNGRPHYHDIHRSRDEYNGPYHYINFDRPCDHDDCPRDDKYYLDGPTA